MLMDKVGLVLSRKQHEQVYLDVGGERIVVTVVDLRGDKVRLGFLASDKVRIVRREVDEREQSEV